MYGSDLASNYQLCMFWLDKIRHVYMIFTCLWYKSALWSGIHCPIHSLQLLILFVVGMIYVGEFCMGTESHGMFVGEWWIRVPCWPHMFLHPAMIYKHDGWWFFTSAWVHTKMYWVLLLVHNDQRHYISIPPTLYVDAYSFNYFD